MKTLDDQIADIEKLDAMRRLARKLKQEAIDLLAAEPYEPRSGVTGPPRSDWEKPGDDVEKAQLLRALQLGKSGHDSIQKTSIDHLIAHLGLIKYADLTPVRGRAVDHQKDSIPVLRSAYILQALTITPGQALSETALACFCRIVQELNEIVHPTWIAGAARADEDSIATAFITGECARALLSFETALAQTAVAAELLGRAAPHLAFIANLGKWGTQEKRFRDYSLAVSLAALPRLIIAAERGPDGTLIKTPDDLLIDIKTQLTSIKPANQIMTPYAAKPVPTDRMLGTVGVTLANAAGDLAMRALDSLKETLTGKAFLPASAKPEKRGKEIAGRLKAAARVIRDLLLPIEQFAEAAIDRQIAANSPHLDVPVDGAELVFAATLLGDLTDWKRPKVRAAYDVVEPLLSANGRLLSLRPFNQDPKGYRLHVATLEVTRRLADLAANLDVEPSPDFVARLMLPLEYTRMPGDRAKSGWTNDPPPREPKSLWWLTAIAAFALDSTVEMLDRTINRRVLPQFQVRQPDTFSLKLDNLFYPDFGLAGSSGRKSMAVVLQELRAHAGHGTLAGKPAFSLILYGPPGTGKTTLVEALACTAGIPLVEVTPSDILVGGLEQMEARARQVFLALSKLTHVVVLFDEFDSILLSRSLQDVKTPTSVAEYLLPGMLTKLKALYDASKVGRVSYVLATNYLDRIDSAASRDGRFDVKCGVYPPDLPSRAGRLLDQLNSFVSRRAAEYEDTKETLEKASPVDSAAVDAIKRQIKENEGLRNDGAVRARILEVVKRSAGGAMSKLGLPGWFTAPETPAKARGMAFGHILANETFDDPKAEADFAYEKKLYKKKNPKPSDVGKNYWKQWEQIRKWDDDLPSSSPSTVTLSDFVKTIDGIV